MKPLLIGSSICQDLLTDPYWFPAFPGIDQNYLLGQLQAFLLRRFAIMSSEPS